MGLQYLTLGVFGAGFMTGNAQGSSLLFDGRLKGSFKRGNGRIDDCTVEKIVLAKLPQRGGGGFQRPCHLATFVDKYSHRSLLCTLKSSEPSSFTKVRKLMESERSDNDHHCSSPLVGACAMTCAATHSFTIKYSIVYFFHMYSIHHTDTVSNVK